MKFIKVSSTKPVVDYLVETLNKHLQQSEQVLWLLSGGSSIPIEVEVSKALSAPTDKLIVGLADERFGKPGHKDSNFRQLNDAGFALSINPILKDQPAEKTTQDYAAFLQKAFRTCDFKLGIVGIGLDGHIAGIKPHSPAVAAKGFACQYKRDDFHRVTMTFPAINLMDSVVTYLAGEAKQKAIEALTKDAPLAEVPSQILKKTKEAIIFNDKYGSLHSS